MEEFLEKLREDQRRMRKFLASQGHRFKRMGDALAVARERGARIFVIAEEPLSGMARVLAEEYLAQLPALGIDLGAQLPEPGSSDSDDGGGFAEGQGPPPRAHRVARHFRSGDVLLVLAHRGEDPITKAILGFAKMKGVYAILIGGLDAKQTLRRAADASLILPTRGLKTVCEASFTCARILARCARAALRERSGKEDEGRLIRVECAACNEAVFVEERYRGKKGQCPLCRAPLRVPEDGGAAVSVARADSTPTRGFSVRDIAVHLADGEAGIGEESEVSEKAIEAATDDDEPATAKPTTRKVPKPEPAAKAPPPEQLKPSVLEIKVPDGAAIERDAALESDVARAAAGPTPAAPEPSPFDRDADDDAVESTGVGLDDDDRPPVGLGSQDSQRAPATKSDPSEIQIAPEDVAFDRFANVTESADPFSLPNGFVQDLVMPAQPAPPPSSPAGRAPSGEGALPDSGSSPIASQSSRLVSARFTISDCRLRFGRGGFPDAQSPEHTLESLSSGRLAFRLNPEDELASTLDKGDEIWVRLEVPAFLEPVLVRGSVAKIGGSSGGSPGGARVELDLRDIDAPTARKLSRAADTLGAPA